MKVGNKAVANKVQQSAYALLQERGAKGWNMDGLAKRAGLAKPTLYKIISSKRQLVEKVILDHMRQMQARLVEIIEGEPDYIQALERMLQEYPSVVSLHAEPFREVFDEYPEIEKEVREHQDDITERIVCFLERGMDERILRNDIQPEFLFDLMSGLIHQNVISGAKGPELAEKIRTAFQCLMEGVRTTRQA